MNLRLNRLDNALKLPGGPNDNKLVISRKKERKKDIRFSENVFGSRSITKCQDFECKDQQLI